MGASSLQRRVAALAVHQPRAGYAIAALVDRGRNRLRPRAVAPVRSMWARPTRLRHWVLWNVIGHPACSSPFPRAVGLTETLTRGGPTLLVGTHHGEVLALSAVLETLPAPRVSLYVEGGVPRPGVHTIDIAETGAVAALKHAVDALRAGGSVLMLADGSVGERIHVQLGGQPFGLGRGAFAAARLAGAPMVPVTAQWKGRSIAFCVGTPIPAGPEADMVGAFTEWLAVQLPHATLPSGPRVGSADRSLSERVSQEAVPDLPAI
jgi:hypothetical protein